MWRVRSFHGWARAAPRSAVAELGVVRRFCTSPVNRSFLIPILSAALLLSSCAHVSSPTAQLPRVPLHSGGEFRIFRVSYGTKHEFGTDSRIGHLFASHHPQLGERYGRGTQQPSVCIWWGWVVSPTEGYVLGPSGQATLLLPHGRKRVLEYPDPTGDVRSLLIDHPPRNQERLRLRVPVNGESVEFEINNPAYERSA